MTKTESSNRRKSGILVSLLLLLVVVIGGYTYSRYMSSGTAKSEAQIAKWSVKIGANDLETYTTEQPLDADLTLVANEFVDDNVIAPGRSGTFDVVIDPTDSQVAIDYIIKVTDVEGTTNDNIKVTGAKYWIGDITGEGTAASVIGDTGATIPEGLEDVKAGKKVTVRVTIEWENDDTNNTVDTTDGKTAGKVSVKTSIQAQQHIA